VNGEKIWISTAHHRQVGAVPAPHGPRRDRTRREARGNHRVHLDMAHPRHRVPAESRHRSATRCSTRCGSPTRGSPPTAASVRRKRRLAGRDGNLGHEAGRAPRGWPSRWPPTCVDESPRRGRSTPTARRPRDSGTGSPGHTPTSSSPKLLNYRALTKIIKGQRKLARGAARQAAVDHLAQTLAELAVDLLAPTGCCPGAAPTRSIGGTWTPCTKLPSGITSIGRGATRCRRTSSPTGRCCRANEVRCRADPPPVRRGRLAGRAGAEPMRPRHRHPVLTLLPARIAHWEPKAGIAGGRTGRRRRGAARLRVRDVQRARRDPADVAPVRGATYWDPLATVRLPRGAEPDDPSGHVSSSCSAYHHRWRSPSATAPWTGCATAG